MPSAQYVAAAEWYVWCFETHAKWLDRVASVVKKRRWHTSGASVMLLPPSRTLRQAARGEGMRFVSVAVGVEFYFAAEDPIDGDGVGDDAGHAEGGDDQHDLEG